MRPDEITPQTAEGMRRFWIRAGLLAMAALIAGMIFFGGLACRC